MLKGLFGKPVFAFPTAEPNTGAHGKLEPPRIDDVTRDIGRVLEKKPTREELQAGYRRYLDGLVENQGCTCGGMRFEEWSALRERSGY